MAGEGGPDIEQLRAPLQAAAGGLGLALSVEQADRLLGYLALLQRWNATYNLTAVREPAQMLTQHLADSLAVVEPLRRRLVEAGRSAEAGAGPVRLLDVGSGAGLPGLVLALMLPGLDVTCVDAVGKKAAFVRQAAGELKLANLHAEHGRIEQLRLAPADVIVSRAFASLADFIVLTRRHLASGGCWLAMKGRRPDDEIAALPTGVAVDRIEPLAVPGLAAERCIVWLRPA